MLILSIKDSQDLQPHVKLDQHVPAMAASASRSNALPWSARGIPFFRSMPGFARRSRKRTTPKQANHLHRRIRGDIGDLGEEYAGRRTSTAAAFGCGQEHDPLALGADRRAWPACL